MNVKIQLRHKNAKIPKRATDLSGGWDLVCTEIIKENEHSYVCKLGISMQPNPNYKITIVPRSSITNTNWFISNSPALGDPDYLGEYMIRFKCIPTYVDLDLSLQPFLCYESFPYKVGDRVAQMYIEEIIPIEWEEVKDFLPTKRGEGGFGSTGNQ